MNRKNTPLPEKAVRFSSFTEILLMAMRTGEYREPGFKQEMNDIVDQVCAEEIEMIRSVAEQERIFLRTEAEILKTEALHALEQQAAAMEILMERKIREIFREAATKISYSESDPDIEIISDEELANIEKDFEKRLNAAIHNFKSKRQESHLRIDRLFTDIINNLKPK